MDIKNAEIIYLICYRLINEPVLNSYKLDKYCL